MLSLQPRGISLIETMITLGIAALVLTLGVPAFGNWVRNAQVRSSAEALRAALQYARGQAVQRNAVVRLALTDAAGTVSWRTGCVRVTASCPALLQSQSADAASTARLGVSTSADSATTAVLSKAIAAGSGLPGAISFTATGTVLTGSVNAITRIDVTDAVNTDVRRISLLIGSAGMIRLCDPLAAGANNPQGCS